MRIINWPLPRERQWTQSRLLRAVNAYVRDGFLPDTVLGRAGRRKTDDRLPAIVAGIKGTNPEITLQKICDWLEKMRERTPRRIASCQPSSVKMLLERAERLGYLSKVAGIAHAILKSSFRAGAQYILCPSLRALRAVEVFREPGCSRR